MIKSYSFYSYKLNTDKLNLIKDYAILINENKNLLSEYMSNHYRLDLFYNKISKYDFIKLTKHLRKDIGSSFYQQAQMEVYTRCKMHVDNLNLKVKDTRLSICLKYLVKAYKNNKEYIMNYLNKSNNNYHKEILSCINKYGDRLFILAEQLQKKLLKQLTWIEFKSLTFNGINQLGKRQPFIESSQLKLANSVINFNIPKVGKIVIPCRHNKKYHGKLSEYKYSYTKSGQSQISYKCQVLNDKIRIILTRETNNSNNNLDIDLENVIGVDVNTKNNLFSLSDGNIIKYDKWLMDKYRRYERYISRIQRIKDERNLDKKPGKKVIRRIQKMNRISKAYADYKSSELVKYCKDNNIKHIVMEDLNLNSKNKYKLKKDGINYRNIIKVLHLNDLKNVVQRIGNRENIMVSLVNPEYTSQTCQKCGHISRDNRQTQETFSCVACGFNSNADTNSAINIKNRVCVPELRDNFMEYAKTDNMFIGKKYIRKDTYINLYNKLYGENKDKNL